MTGFNAEIDRQWSLDAEINNNDLSQDMMFLVNAICT